MDLGSPSPSHGVCNVKHSAISWTDFSGGDANFITGCTPVSAGCAHCYARGIYERFGRNFGQVQCHPDKLTRLLKHQFPEKGSAGARFNRRGDWSNPMVFLCDTGDLFHPDVRTSFILDAFDMMAGRPDVTWQILTKRAERMREVVTHWCGSIDGEVPATIWLGVTAENQAMADERIPLLLQVPAAVRFVSVEPMLEPISLLQACDVRLPNGDMPAVDGIGQYLRWVICGGESGPDRRPFMLSWAEDLHDQCKAAGVAFFGKQVGGLRPGTPLPIHGELVHEWPAPKED